MPALRRRPAASLYRLERERGRAGRLRVTVLTEGERPRALRHVAVHSPEGFECGYGGSGPADLALSLLADLFELPRAASAWHSPKGLAGELWTLHQPFKARWIAGLEVAAGEARELDAQELYDWALAQRARLRGADFEPAQGSAR
jgi:Family of unknown function (DUF6166)